MEERFVKLINPEGLRYRVLEVDSDGFMKISTWVHPDDVEDTHDCTKHA